MDIESACNIYLENPTESKLPHELSTFKSRTYAYREVLFKKMVTKIGLIKLFLLEETGELITLKELFDEQDLEIDELIYLFYNMTEKKIKEEREKEGNFNDLLIKSVLDLFKGNKDRIIQYFNKTLDITANILDFDIFLEQIGDLIKKDLEMISKLSDKIDDIQIEVLEMFIYFVYKNLVITDTFIIGFNNDYNKKQKNEFSEPVGLFDEDLISYISNFYQIVKNEVEKDPVSQKLFLFELMVSFFLSKDFDRNTILEILDNDYHISLEDCSRNLEIVFFDDYKEDFSAPLVLKMGKTELIKGNSEEIDSAGESKSRKKNVMRRGNWHASIPKLLLDIIIYYDIRYAVGIILYLTDLCNKNGIQISKQIMQPKQFKIALECLYNGCMPFVLNPNKDLNVLPFMESVFQLHDIEYKESEKVKGMTWCNLFSSPKISIDDLKRDYHCIMPAKRRLDYILADKKKGNLYTR